MVTHTKIDMNKWYYLLFPIAACFSCGEDGVSPNEIRGSWEWVRSVGGFGGWTLTPSSEGITRQLLIDKSTYREYENNILVAESAYVLETKDIPGFGHRLYLEVDNFGYYAVERDGNELTLIEICYDCFDHTYVLK